MLDGTMSFQRISLVLTTHNSLQHGCYREEEPKSGYPFSSFFLVLFLEGMMPYAFLLSVFLKNFATCFLISNLFKVRRKCSDIKSFYEFSENWRVLALKGHLG